MSNRTLNDIPTPALILDRNRLTRNLETMSERARRHGLDLRPHLKTAKSLEIGRLATAGHSGGITVSTLREAAYFVEGGLTDITYAVGLAPDKIDAVAALQRDGAWINVLVDNVPAAKTLAKRANALGANFRALIEIDTGGHRAGLTPDADELVAVAQALAESSRVDVRGVLSHAGHSYNARGEDAIAAVAEEERHGLVVAAQRLREAGFACPAVCPGSTPTAVFGKSWEGCTEMRPGNYMFFDLFQAGLGTCSLDDIAVSVLSTVIGHKPEYNRFYIDAGALALSKDSCANETMPGAGYGLVCNLAGHPIAGVHVANMSQEHGWVTCIDANTTVPFERFPIGSRVRVLPNHSCLTAAAYDRYHVVDDGEIVAEWPRINGW